MVYKMLKTIGVNVYVVISVILYKSISNIKNCSSTLPSCDWTASIPVLLVVIVPCTILPPLVFLILDCLLDRLTSRFSRHQSSLVFSPVVVIFQLGTAFVIVDLLCSGGYVLQTVTLLLWSVTKLLWTVTKLLWTVTKLL